MGYVKFELNLQSASNLQNIRRLFGRMKVYARVTVNDDGSTLVKTPVDKTGGTNPVWEFQAKYIINKSAFRPQDDTMLTIRLYYKRSRGGDGYIGEVRVPLKELFQRSNQGRDEVFETRVVADPMQLLNFSYKFTRMTNTQTTGCDWMMRLCKLCKFYLRLRFRSVLVVLVVNLSNTKDLRRLFGKMKVYARVKVKDDANTVAENPVDMNGKTNPVWNFRAKYILSKSAVQRDGTMLTVKLYYRRSFGRDGYIGEVRVFIVKTIGMKNTQ
ncbi:unnamed protein product [Ilex paraguariensis]|uniref:C2 domain-containing protein n=1 Tax=Ilex paraguariensis TaxID=185542 RepID=A0ABC8R4Y1_9AQUA